MKREEERKKREEVEERKWKEKLSVERKRWEETWFSILHDYEKYKDQRGVRDLFIDGIPESIWGKVWMWVTGNSNSITKNLFEICLERGERLWVTL